MCAQLLLELDMLGRLEGQHLEVAEVKTKKDGAWRLVPALVGA